MNETNLGQIKFTAVEMEDTRTAQSAKAKAFNRIDLDKLVQDFVNWQKTTATLVHDNDSLKQELKVLTKQLQISQVAEKTAGEEVKRLMSLVDNLQSLMSKRCDFEEENIQLKEQIIQAKESAEALEQEHNKQMTEAFNNHETAVQEHKKEIAKIKEEYLQQAKREVSLLEKTLQEKNGELKQLQKQLVEIEREKHTEIVKLRLEYDAKLLKHQRTNAKAQSAQSSNANSEIYRKKLQFATAEKDKEIVSMKKRVADLERQLANTQRHPQAKRKRF